MILSIIAKFDGKYLNFHPPKSIGSLLGRKVENWENNNKIEATNLASIRILQLTAIIFHINDVLYSKSNREQVAVWDSAC